jgi:hypothetical protein
MIADHLKSPYQFQPKKLERRPRKTGLRNPVSAENGNCRFPVSEQLRFNGRWRCNAVLHARNYCAAKVGKTLPSWALAPLNGFPDTSTTFRYRYPKYYAASQLQVPTSRTEDRFCAHQPQCVGTSDFLGSVVASNLKEVVWCQVTAPLTVVGLVSRYCPSLWRA